jgi:hypothetical protein
MVGHISVYGIGSMGVNLVKDPLELADQEATQLQNAELVPDESKGGEGSLSKRGGLSALTSALAGAIQGMVALPLQTNYVRKLYVALGEADGSEKWMHTTDGTTFTTVSTPSLGARVYNKYVTVLTGQSSLLYSPRGRPVAYKTKVLYVGDDYTPGSTTSTIPIVLFNGTDYDTLFRIPVGPNSDGTGPYAVTDMLQANGKVYIAVAEKSAAGNFHGGRVLAYDPIANTVSQVANAMGSGTGEVDGQNNPTCLAWYQGQLFCGLHATNSGTADIGKIVRCYPDFDSSWTTDVSNLNGKPNSLAVFKGDLYVGTSVSDSPGTVSKRGTTGAWTDVESVAQSHFTNLIVFNDTLYAVRYTDDASDSLVIRSSSDGSTWADSRDVYANDSGSTLRYCTGSAVFNGAVYFAFSPSAASDIGTNGFVMRYDGATWTKITHEGNISGQMFVLTTRS